MVTPAQAVQGMELARVMHSEGLEAKRGSNAASTPPPSLALGRDVSLAYAGSLAHVHAQYAICCYCASCTIYIGRRFMSNTRQQQPASVGALRHGCYNTDNTCSLEQNVGDMKLDAGKASYETTADVVR